MADHRKTLAAALATVLTSVSLYPIFIGTTWFWAGAGAAVTVAGAGALTRLRRLPLLACLAGSVLGLVLYLNLVFEAGQSFIALVPTPSSLTHLVHLASQGMTESSKYAPPVPELAGMVLLATGGIGITAVLTDLIAVRIGSASLAGLPLLLLVTEPFTLSVSRGVAGTTIAFCVGTAGYLTLLSTEGQDRIREWERSRPEPGRTPDTSALAAAGRRAGIASVALALCVPLVIPGLHMTRLFGHGTPGIGGSGGSGGVGFPSPDTQVSNELRQGTARPVLTYQASNQAPEYFQIYVLDNLTNSGWTLLSDPRARTPVKADLPAAPGLTNLTWAAPVNTKVTISQDVGTDSISALPTPYPATGVNAPGSLQADVSSLMIFDPGIPLAGLSYTVTSLDLEPPGSALANASPAPDEISSHFSEVPPSYGSLRGLAQSIAAGGDAKSQFGQAVALQQWLAGGQFKYSLNAPTVTNADGLKTFLDAKKGYCQQFSFAMAVLARLLGIPSRIAYGYTAGSAKPDNTWLVTTHDAHAWPELYFQGFGWLRFEPTPQGSSGQGTAFSPVYTQQPTQQLPTSPTGVSPGGQAVPTPGANGASGRLRNQLGLSEGGAGSAGLATGAAGPNPWELAGLSLLGLLLLAAVTPACARLVIRRRRWRSGARGGDAQLAHMAWRELRDHLVDYRVGYLPSESPRALASRVIADLRLTEPAATALRRLTMATERARYSASPDGGGTLLADSAVVRRAVAAAAPRRARWRARLFPSSVLTPAGTALSQATDLFGRLNTEWPGKSRLAKHAAAILARTARAG
jgi:transglutaminase-like putative cysteine protease